MEYHLDPKNDSREQQSSGSLESTVQAQACQSLELQEKPDLHDAVTGKVKDVPPQPSRSQKKQQTYRKAAEEEEVVKFMSSVPGYLERGEKPQEKVLNVGVLDWGLLEKWQYSKKQSTCKSSTCSPSSSSVSTDGSSIDSTRRHSSSPSHERIRRLSLQYHLMASPIGDNSSAARSSEECVGKFQDPEAPRSSFANGKFKFVSTDQPFSDKLVVTNPKISKESRAMEKKLSYRVVSTPQRNMKAQDGEYARKAEMPQEHKSNTVGQDVPQRPKTVVGTSQVSGPTNMFVQRSAEASRMSFSDISKEAYDVDVKSGIRHSCPLPYEVNSNGGSHLEQPGSIDAESVKFPPALCHSVSRSAKKGTSPSRGSNLQETNPAIVHSNSIEKELSKKSNMKASKATTEKPSKQLDVKASKAATRKATIEIDLKASKAAVEKPSTSPLLQFSMGMAKISKSSGHAECLTAPQFASSYISVKSGPENVVVSTSLDCSSNGRPESTARARTSPLRRLLDPLIKPKAVNCRKFSEPSLRGYHLSTDSASRLSSNGLLDSSAEHLGKGKSELNDSCQGKKQRSTFQALLRLAFKNGLPLFTFTIDNDSEILAATLKSSTSEKEEQRSIYTFFNIREVKKKKASWITHGGKEKSPNYIPDILAQMKVFDVQPSNLTWPNSVDHFRVKEYVLFSVELGEEDQGTSNFKPNDELAAIVVKMPIKMQKYSIGNGYESNNYNKLSGIGLEDCFPGFRQYSYSGDNRQNSYSAGIQESISTTVILPSDVHSLPSKGEPSSLVHRWRSGGSCDCGGWDLGCKLKILANSNQQLTKKLSSSSTKDQFELFSQDVREENQPALSLAPFKDGIFSVEFNPSLSLLQAFSTCIAILDSWKPCELSFSSYAFEEKASGETIQVRNGGTRVLKHVEENHPTKYVSFPPLSPVGRV